MWWIVTLSLLGMAALAAGAALSGGHYEGEHAAPRHPDPEPWPPAVGSMDLEAERGWGGLWPAPPVDPEPWRVQTAAELSPVALAGLPDDNGWTAGSCLTDPGPGEAPSDPGPDPPARHSDLGPGARAVLARYERRFHELWACPWLDLGGLT